MKDADTKAAAPAAPNDDGTVAPKLRLTLPVKPPPMQVIYKGWFGTRVSARETPGLTWPAAKTASAR